jgi:LysM repeat protein
MTKDCNKFYTVVPADDCTKIIKKHSMSLSQLYSWNPYAAENECMSLQIADILCVGTIGGVSMTAQPTGTTSSPTTTTSSSTGVATPQPTQEGMISGCKKFYQVRPNDICIKVAQAHGLTWAKFKEWNKGVGDNCEYLQLNVYYCIGI